MKIAFVAFRVLSYFTKNNSKAAGGSETQQVILGREFAKNGHEVIFIVHDEGQEEKITIGGVTIIKSFSPEGRLPLAGFCFDLFKLWNALKKADADIYIQQGSGYVTGIIALFCKLYRKKFVFMLGAQRDANSALAFAKAGRIMDRKLYQYGIEHANLVICQNMEQKAELANHHFRDAFVITNGYNISDNLHQLPGANDGQKDTILWVGHMRPIKRPEMYLDIAAKIQDAKFIMIGGFHDKAIEEKIRGAAKQISNINIVGHVPYHKIFYYYNNACLLVNTSESEGFPNAFIEAWMHYLPVVSVGVNPDDVITKYDIGFHCKDAGEAAQRIKELLADKDLRVRMGCCGRKYVEEHHDIRKQVHTYISHFEKLRAE